MWNSLRLKRVSLTFLTISMGNAKVGSRPQTNSVPLFSMLYLAGRLWEKEMEYAPIVARINF